MRYLDDDGRVFFGRFLRDQQRPTLPVNEIPDAQVPAPPSSLQQQLALGSWEYHIARFLQRVQDVRELLREDLQEISEPLTALLTSGQASSEGQQAHLRAVEEDYQRTMQVVDQALAQMLRHFPAEAELLSQGCREHLSQRRDLSQEEQVAEVALP